MSLGLLGGIVAPVGDMIVSARHDEVMRELRGINENLQRILARLDERARKRMHGRKRKKESKDGKGKEE